MKEPEHLFARFSDTKLEAMHRVAKTRLYPWFRDPRAMKALRDEISSRRSAAYWARLNDAKP